MLVVCKMGDAGNTWILIGLREIKNTALPEPKSVEVNLPLVLGLRKVS